MDGGKHAKPKEPGKIRGILDKFKLKKPKHQASDIQDPPSPELRVLGGRDMTQPQETPAADETTPANGSVTKTPTAVEPTEKPIAEKQETPAPSKKTFENSEQPVSDKEVTENSEQPVSDKKVTENPELPVSDKEVTENPELPVPDKEVTENPELPVSDKEVTENLEQQPANKKASEISGQPEQQKEQAKVEAERQKAENAAEKARQAAVKKAAKEEKKALAQKKAIERKKIKAEKAAQRPKLDPDKVAKAAYQIGIAFLVVVIGLSLWLGRETYTLSGLQSWFQLEFTGLGEGDGFPVKIKGHTINQNNFTHVGSNVAALSNTALTLYNQSGKEQYTVRHSFENPGMSHAGDQFILYDIGGSKYIVQNGAKTKQDLQSTEDILTAAISQSGVYALAVEKDGYASWIDVYASNGTKKYTYQFSQQYVTSMAINPEGTQGIVCAVITENGTLQSVITVLDFNETTPLYEHKISGNMLVDALWGENNVIYAIGDKALHWSSGGESFEEYSYGGQQLIAYQLEGSWAAIAVSNNAYAGESTLLSFTGAAEPLQIDFPEHVKSLSSFGSMIGALYGDTVGFYDRTTGQLMGESTGNDDIKSIALSNERSAYTLAISEIRLIVAQSTAK